MTLREVSARIGDSGEPLPPSTLARIEHGQLEPGVRRLNLLLRLYDIDAERIADMVEHETGGVPLPDHGDLERLGKDAVRLWHAGKLKEAVANWLAALEIEPADEVSRDVRHRAAIGFASAMRDHSRLRIARRVIDRLLCEELSPNVKWMVYQVASMVWRDMGALEMAQTLLNHALNVTRPDDSRAYAVLLQQQARYALMAGDIETAEATMVHAQRHVDALDEPSLHLRTQLFCGRIAMHAGDPAKALEWFERAQERVDADGLEMGRCSVLVQRVWALTELGEFDSALALGKQARTVAVAADDRSSEFDALHRIWKLHVAAGKHAEARVALEQARLLTSFVEERSAEVDEVLAAE